MRSFLRRLAGRFRPYRILTPTLGRIELVRLSGLDVSPLIRWRWFAIWPVRRLAMARAYDAASDLLLSEWVGVQEVKEVKADDEEPKGRGWSYGKGRPLQTKDLPPQAFACDMCVVTGYGLPDDWRRVRWRDAVYIARLHRWRNTLPDDRRGEIPDWSRPRGED